MSFFEGYGSNMVSAGQKLPAVAVWDDGGTEDESVIAVEMRLGGLEYSKGLELMERVFGIIRQVFPLLKYIKRESPKVCGHQTVLRCTAAAVTGGSIGIGEISVSERTETEAYTEIFQDEPRKVSTRSSGYEILMKGILMTEEELRSLKEIKVGTYTYRELTVKEIKKKGGIVESARMISLRREKL